MTAPPEDARGELAASLVGPAMRLAGIVHDGDPNEGAALVASLTPEQRWALPFVLAAMVDVTRTAEELLSWARRPLGVEPPPHVRALTPLSPASRVLAGPKPGPAPTYPVCGTVEGWADHRAAGEDPCQACVVAKAAAKRTADRDARAAVRGRPAWAKRQAS